MKIHKISNWELCQHPNHQDSSKHFNALIHINNIISRKPWFVWRTMDVLIIIFSWFGDIHSST
jgi:hypothetical protein